MPLLVDGLLTWLNNEELSRAALLSDGELILIASGLAAAGIGDILFDRPQGSPGIGIQHAVAVGMALLVIVLGSGTYYSMRSDDRGMQVAGNQSAETGDTDPQKAANLSLVIFFSGLVASGSCVALAETRGEV